MLERIVGRVDTFDDIRAILDAYRKERGITLLALDDISGLQHGYNSKLAANIKKYGNLSLPCVLGALGLELWIVRTTSAHKETVPHSKVYAKKYHEKRKKLAALGGKAKNAKTSPEERRAGARKAAIARWTAVKKLKQKKRGLSNKKVKAG